MDIITINDRTLYVVVNRIIDLIKTLRSDGNYSDKRYALDFLNLNASMFYRLMNIKGCRMTPPASHDDILNHINSFKFTNV